MNLQEFKKILCSAVKNVYHEQAHKETGSYAVWHEYGRGREANNRYRKIQIDYYTAAEYDDTPDKIVEALDVCAEIAVKEPIVDYDTDMKKWRYIIQCEVVV